jgi:hypothetical protein
MLCSSEIIKINGSNVSDSFIEEVRKSFGEESIDSQVKKAIQDTQKLIIGVAENVKQVFPRKDREWGYSYLKDDSAWLLFFENKDSNHKFDLSSITRHEFGHHADFMFRKTCGCDYTDQQGFSEIYLKDKNKLKNNKKAMLKEFCEDWEKALYLSEYYVEGKGYKVPALGGKWETFAEIFAMLNGGSGGESRCKGMDDFYKAAFPKVVADVKKLLINLKQDRNA